MTELTLFSVVPRRAIDDAQVAPRHSGIGNRSIPVTAWWAWAPLAWQVPVWVGILGASTQPGSWPHTRAAMIITTALVVMNCLYMKFRSPRLRHYITATLSFLFLAAAGSLMEGTTLLPMWAVLAEVLVPTYVMLKGAPAK